MYFKRLKTLTYFLPIKINGNDSPFSKRDSFVSSATLYIFFLWLFIVLNMLKVEIFMWAGTDLCLSVG